MNTMARIVCSIIGLMLTSDLLAGIAQVPSITITYMPAAVEATNVPALSDVMLVLMTVILALVAFHRIKNGRGGTPLASIIALMIAGAGLMPGINVIQDVQAIAAGLSNPAGGTYEYFFGEPNADEPVFNYSGVNQRITGTSFNTNGTPGCVQGIPATNPCSTGTEVADNQFCNVRVNCAGGK